MNRRITSLTREMPKNIKRDADQALFDAVDTWYSGYRTELINRMLHKEEHAIDWTCLVCKTGIKVDVNTSLTIYGKQMYCDSCRPMYVTELHLTDLSMVRHIANFYSHLKNTIVENSNMPRLYDTF